MQNEANGRDEFNIEEFNIYLILKQYQSADLKSF